MRGGAARSFHQVLEMWDGTQLGKATPGCLKHGAKDVLFLLRMCDLCSLSQLVHFCKSHFFSGPCFSRL